MPTRTPENRTPEGRFAPGTTGNPGGRPKAIAEVIELARSHTEEAVSTLAHIAKAGKSEAARIAASVALLDRGWGKPAQVITDGAAQRPIENYTDEELIAMIGEVRTLIAKDDGSQRAAQ